MKTPETAGPALAEDKLPCKGQGLGEDVRKSRGAPRTERQRPVWLTDGTTIAKEGGPPGRGLD